MIERIFISPDRGSGQIPVEQVDVHFSMGIVGDRNFGMANHPGQNLTLIEAEEIESFCEQQGREIEFSATRRNLVTRGVQLNSLVGKQFRVGDVVLLGIELCEPCTILGESLASNELTSPDVIKHWVGRGGLRTDVLVGGVIKVGDSIQPRTLAEMAEKWIGICDGGPPDLSTNPKHMEDFGK